jgi:hypothetical protein
MIENKKELVESYSRAVHQVLLREGDEVSSLESVGTLSGSSGGERPAASAITLVLDLSDDVSCSPVNSCVVVVSNLAGNSLIKTWMRYDLNLRRECKEKVRKEKKRERKGKGREIPWGQRRVWQRHQSWYQGKSSGTQRWSSQQSE